MRTGSAPTRLKAEPHEAASLTRPGLLQAAFLGCDFDLTWPESCRWPTEPFFPDCPRSQSADVHGEFVLMQQLVFGISRGNVSANDNVSARRLSIPESRSAFLPSAPHDCDCPYRKPNRQCCKNGLKERGYREFEIPFSWLASPDLQAGSSHANFRSRLRRSWRTHAVA